MADFNEYSQKGSTLMQQALKKLAEGDVDGFEHDRKEANRYFDMFYEEIDATEKNIRGLYGESLNFGIIYNVFEQNIDNLYETEDGKKTIKEVYNLIKNNRLLNEQFKVYDLFEKSTNVKNVKDFVNESVSLIKNHDKEKIIESNRKLIELIEKRKLNEYVEIPEETENLYEAIEYLILNKKSFNNINNYVNAQNVIAEHIENNNKIDIDEEKQMTFDKFKEVVNEEQAKIDNELNEEEKKLLNLFTDKKKNHRAIFENYKRKTLSKIEGVLKICEDCDKEGWQKVYENFKSRTFSDNVSENIVNCAEMLETCSTIDE